MLPAAEKRMLYKGVGTLKCCGSVTFWYGSGSADPYNWVTNPDSDLAPILLFSSVTFKMSTKEVFFPKLFAFYFFKVHLHPSSKTKSHEEVKKNINQGFSNFFARRLKDPDPWEPKHTDTTDPEPQHWLEGWKNSACACWSFISLRIHHGCRFPMPVSCSLSPYGPILSKLNFIIFQP